MEQDSRSRLAKSGSFSIADILNKSPCESTGNLSCEKSLPKMDSKTSTEVDQQLLKPTDKLDSKVFSLEGKSRDTLFVSIYHNR